MYAGQLWNIADRWLNFGDYDPSRRTAHETRYVLVLQGDDAGDNGTCPTVLVAPLSSNMSAKRPWEDVLEPDESRLARPSIVKLHLLQPIPRRVLIPDGTLVSTLDDDVLGRMQLHLLANLGLDDPTE